MTSYDHSPPNPDDSSLLQDLLSPLKCIEPPLEARIAHRVAIASELERLRTAKLLQNRPWWSRSISIPVPIAASALLLGSLALAAGVRGWLEEPPLSVATSTVPPVTRSTVLLENSGGGASRDPLAHAALAYYESETYLCGIGRVSSEFRFGVQEPNP